MSPKRPLTRVAALLAVTLPLGLAACTLQSGGLAPDSSQSTTPAIAEPPISIPAPPGMPEIADDEAAANDPAALPDTAGQGTVWTGVTYTPATAQAALQSLPETAPTTMDGYDRDLYPHWESGIEYGWNVAIPGSAKCNVRSAALLRDGEQIEVNDNCTVVAGVWAGPYDGQPIYNPKDLDADHLVPLAEAHRQGASTWDAAKREQFANDPLVVLTTEAGANRSKGDSHPGEWKPELRDVWCGYAVRWIQIKDTYGLTLSTVNRDGGQTERLGLEEMLNTCT